MLKTHQVCQEKPAKLKGTVRPGRGKKEININVKQLPQPRHKLSNSVFLLLFSRSQKGDSIQRNSHLKAQNTFWKTPDGVY